ncbi:MAG: hypothetical protein EHM93_09505 [Bacteroidales bacterium]|nr:MAG: hypothetical protein EHM93_09505 [Bacteroidales bacterium]
MREFFCNVKVVLILFSILFSFFQLELNAQQIDDLKEKKKKIEKDINEISTLIQKTEKESTTSLTNIKLTKKKIDLKNSLIKQIDDETDEVQKRITFRKNKIDSLGYKIKLIKEEYRRIIVFSQKSNLNNNLLMQIFSANDFNQAYKRLKFYQQVLIYKKQIVSNYRKSINEIKDETSKLNENINQLTQKQKEKEREVGELKKDELNYQLKVNLLNKKKKQLVADLEEQKQISKKLNDEIRKLIEEEARKEIENKTKSKSVSINYVALSNNFKENIGKFNLPVLNGMVTGVYGESFHPVLKEVKVKNNGVDITISTNSQVFAIFKGEVRKVIKIMGSNLAVLIRHGNYLSVYSNLTVVNVSVGQDITSYQKIGEINLQKGEETAILHFELWNENKTEDPSKWFRK